MLSIEDINLFEVDEAFSPSRCWRSSSAAASRTTARVNQYGGAIAFRVDPLASSAYVMTQLARQFKEQPEVRYGLTTMSSASASAPR